MCTETVGSSVQLWQDPVSELSGVKAELLLRALENRSTGALSIAQLLADTRDIAREHGCLLHLPCSVGPSRSRAQPVLDGMGWGSGSPVMDSGEGAFGVAPGEGGSHFSGLSREMTGGG